MLRVLDHQGHMNNNNGFVQAVAGDPLAVVRDALLSQLQHDRLRKEIIVAELAKIERAMALRDASPSPSPTPRHAAGKTAASQVRNLCTCMLLTNLFFFFSHYDIQI
jgi:hypothetical protein